MAKCANVMQHRRQHNDSTTTHKNSLVKALCILKRALYHREEGRSGLVHVKAKKHQKWQTKATKPDKDSYKLRRARAILAESKLNIGSPLSALMGAESDVKDCFFCSEGWYVWLPTTSHYFSPPTPAFYVLVAGET